MDQELIRARTRRAEKRRAKANPKRKRRIPPTILFGHRQRTRKRSRMSAFVLAGVALLALTFVVSIVSFGLTSAATVGATVRQYREVNASLPNAAEVASQAFQTTSIYDRNGKLLQNVDQPEGGAWRNFVELNQISPYLIQATIASEDATFWTHYGVEPVAIVRGATIILSGTGSSGGSTITQQLARGLYPDQIGTDYSITRKIDEAMAAVAIEQQFSKQDILTMYLNLIFYGQLPMASKRPR